MSTAMIKSEIVESMLAELHDADLEIWKRAQNLAIERHLIRGEIVRRYVKQFHLQVNATVALLSEHGISERTIQHSLHIYDTYWKGDLETSLKELPEGDNITVRKLLGTPSKEIPQNCPHSCKYHKPV